jgi:hypothetical protein
MDVKKRSMKSARGSRAGYKKRKEIFVQNFDQKTLKRILLGGSRRK